MGNTINPVAFRLGWSRGWVDTYYSNELYYPQLLHKVLKMRFLLNNLLIEVFKGAKRTAYIFSHIIINKFIKKFNIDIYFYDALTQRAWDKFYGRLVKRKTRAHIDMLLKFKKLARIRKHIWIRPLKLRVYFMILFFYAKFVDYSVFNSSSVFKKNWTKILYYTFNKNPIFFKDKDQIYNQDENLFYHFIIINKFLRNNRHGYVWNKNSEFLESAKNMYHSFFTFTWTLSFAESIKIYLYRLFNHLFINDHINFNFFKFNNDSTNAMFLANYLAKKFSQGYRKIWSIINPIRKELDWRLKIRFENFVYDTRIVKILRNRKLRKKNLRINTLNILTNYNLLYSLQLFTKKVLVNFDSFFISYTFFRKKNKQIRSLIKKYFFVKPLVFLAFKIPSHTFLIMINNYMTKDKKNIIKDNYFWINNIFDDIHKNYGNISNTTVSPFYASYHLVDIVKLGISSYIKYLDIKYSKYLSKWEYDFYKINKLNLRNRIKKIKRFRRLLGYKIQLKGRFTRKQIAAKYIFKKGKVKTSSISNDIDYGFATIPLLNSSVGIKVWLNWNNPNNIESIKVA